MNRIEILLNQAFSSNTITNIDFSEDTLYTTQQNLSFIQDYYSYNNNTFGRSLVNDLNVKSFLNKPENESIAQEFVNYLRDILSVEEFRDLFYDNKKLSEFFNQYYKKFKSFSHQGRGSTNYDPSVNLFEEKRKSFNEDGKYLKTNSLTNYFTNLILDETVSSNQRFIFDNIDPSQFNVVPNIYVDRTIPSDYIGFTGRPENYYVQFKINKKNKLFFSENFNEYFKDVCNGSINYRKFTYTTQINSNITYGNLDQLIEIQNLNGSNFGPDQNSISQLESLLPVNYLQSLAQSNGGYSQPAAPTNAISYSDSVVFGNENNGTYLSYHLFPDQNNMTQTFIPSFNFFKNFFNWNYRRYNPNFNSVYNNPNFNPTNKGFIYVDIIDFIDRSTVYVPPDEEPSINTSLNVSMGSGNNGGPSNNNNIPCQFEFDPFPDSNNNAYNSPNHVGQIFDNDNTNTFRIRIKNRYPSINGSAILNYEYFSPSSIGEENEFNSFNLGIPNQTPTTDNNLFTFLSGETYQTLDLQIYKNWSLRTPIVLSLRSSLEDIRICQYMIIYLEEFFDISQYYLGENIDVDYENRCNLYYNGFVKQNFNDNFLEYYRPENIPVNYPANLGFTLSQRDYDPIIEEAIDERLNSILNNRIITLSSIARLINVPISAIYNIYLIGAHYYEKNQASSDADISIVAETNKDSNYFKLAGIDFAIYNPRTFQYQLNEFAVPAFQNSTLLADRNFFHYFTEENNFKILERIQFSTNITIEDLKNKAILIADSQFNDSQKYFLSKDSETFQKRVWNTIRVLKFAIQYVKFNKIVDRKEANSYLNDVELPFENFQQVRDYFMPIINNLKAELLSL